MRLHMQSRYTTIIRRVGKRETEKEREREQNNPSYNKWIGIKQSLINQGLFVIASNIGACIKHIDRLVLAIYSSSACSFLAHCLIRCPCTNKSSFNYLIVVKTCKFTRNSWSESAVYVDAFFLLWLELSFFILKRCIRNCALSK